jgi:transposase
MRFAGIDIGSRSHVVALTDERGAVLVRPTSFAANWAGHETLFGLLDSPADLLVAMEATGHYSRNLFSALVDRGYAVALINPLRTRRFAEEDLMRAKTDSVDALAIARFAAQKRPAPTEIDRAFDQLREFVCFYNRILQDYNARLRQLYRLVHLCFPEFLGPVRTLDSQRAATLLHEYPTARAFAEASIDTLACLRMDGRRRVGVALAHTLIEAARLSVGRHDGPAFRSEVQLTCTDLALLRERARMVGAQIEAFVAPHPVGSLLKTIDGISAITVGRILAAVGDPGRLRSAGALASYVGVVPGTSKSGLRRPNHSRLSPLGNPHLRHALYMATFAAVQRNPWLGSYYKRLKAAGKPPKVALIATVRKLLCAVYSVAKHRKPFVCPAGPVVSATDPSLDHKHAEVQRNGPKEPLPERGDGSLSTPAGERR